MDCLPALASDPFWAEPNRMDKDFEQCCLLDQLLTSCALQHHTPTHNEGNPMCPYAEQCIVAPVTRIPIGDQHGLPSWIDHCASDGTVISCWVSWENAPADHAGLVARCRYVHKASCPLKRKTWVCADLARAEQYAQANAPTSFSTVPEFHTFIASVQDANSTPETCAVRRGHREPPAIKDLRSQLRHAHPEKQCRRLQKMIWEGRKHWLNTLRLIRQKESFKSGADRFGARKKCTTFPACELSQIQKRSMTTRSGAS